MLVGNDFLPPLPTLDIAEGALNTLFDTYRDMLPSLGGYISGDKGGGTFNAPRLEKILSAWQVMSATCWNKELWMFKNTTRNKPNEIKEW